LPPVPEDLRTEREDRGQFYPAPDLAEWLRETFVAEDGPLAHPTHSHLRHAYIAALWTNHEYNRKGRRVLGRADLATAPHGVYGWDRARMSQQRREWFGGWFDGSDPDFLITVFGPWVHRRRAEGDALAIGVLMEHELCHCAQATVSNGAPKFDDMTGRPKFEITGHDVEAFTHEVRRYGAHSDPLDRMRKAFQEAPTVDEPTVRGVCGCGAPVAA